MWYTGLSEKPHFTSDLLANADEILGRDFRILDRFVGRVAYCHRRTKNPVPAK
jgi:hypothetical protein